MCDVVEQRSERIAIFANHSGHLASFEVREPLGQTWTEEWLTHDVQLALGSEAVTAGQLRLVGPDGDVPAQFYRRGKLLAAAEKLAGTVELRVLFRASIVANKTPAFLIADGGAGPPAWPRVAVTRRKGRTVVEDGMVGRPDT